MPPDQDPKEGSSSVATATSGRDNGPSGGSGQDVELGTGTTTTISVTEHERIVKEERGRRAGQERQHQRAYQKLEKELEDLKTRVLSGSSSASDDDIPKELAELLDPNNPRDRIILDVARNQQKWARANAEDEAKKRREAALKAEIDDAVQTVTSEWEVPDSALDKSTPEAVYRSAERWQAAEEVRKLKERQQALESDLKAVREGAATVATRTRQELGATRVSTSTGTPPEVPSANQEEIQRLDGEIAKAKREHRGADAIALMRERDRLRTSA